MSIYVQSTSPMTRPETPESSLANSLYNATHTIEELTAALAEFSSHRVPSPDPQTCLTCCCGKEECGNLTEWMATKGKLESRLRLSAEVGQALLQKHEAYVRRHEVPLTRQVSIAKSIDSYTTDEGHLTSSQEERDAYVGELIKEKALLEKRLNEALVNNEVSEVSTKSILQELEHARATISRLTASQARSTGWDARLSAAIKEREDLQQERDIESQRARLAESRFTALKEKTAKLHVEVRKLQDSLDSKRMTHMDLSESTLQDARTRIQLMQKGQLSALSRDEHDELMKLMESLVNDNEILKRDNAELQNLLADCREDVHALQEEVEEQRVNNTRTLRHKWSIAESLSGKDKEFSIIANRNTSVDRDKDFSLFEPLTPETTRRPLSPTTHISISTPSESIPWTSQPEAGLGFCPQMVYELDPDALDEAPVEEYIPVGNQPIFTCSRGVQAFIPGALRASGGFPLPQNGQYSGGLHPLHLSNPAPALTSSDPRSESSSFSSETLTSHIAILLERLNHLFTKLSQSDALTLTNRLKRQQLYHGPGDVKHLSRSSVNQILSETATLRAQFRVLLEDEKMAVLCTRKEVRALFRLMREVFSEMGRMRVLLNDVILDPTEAGKISEAAMDPSKATTGAIGKNGWDWMGSLSKLFAPSFKGEKRHYHDLGADEIGAIKKSASGRSGISGSGISGGFGVSGNPSFGAPTRPRTIAVPKIAPALGASATTVNVEFLAAGVKGRTVTNTFASDDLVSSSMVQNNGSVASHAADRQEADWPTQTQVSSGSGPGGNGGGSRRAQGTMDIFVGAPPRGGSANVLGDEEPWIVLPKAPKKAKSMVFRERGRDESESQTTSPVTVQTTQEVPVPDSGGSKSSDIGDGNLNDATSSVLLSAGTEDSAGRIITGLSRYVDAVIDPVFRSASSAGQAVYVQPPSLPRSPLAPSRLEANGLNTGEAIERSIEQPPGQTPVYPRLRRGLSDSSIHSTFTTHGERDTSPSSPLRGVDPATSAVPSTSGVGVPVPNRQQRFPITSSLWLDRQTVLQALSRTVQTFRLGHTGGHSSGTTTPAESGASFNPTDGPEQSTPDPSAASSSSTPARDVKAGNQPQKKRGKPRPFAPANSTVRRAEMSYYSSMNTVSGAMGAAALLNSLPAPPSMRDPFVWEA